MPDSPTLKAIASTILTFALVVAVGAFTSAIGQNTTLNSRAPSANPYETVESDPAVAAHNRPGPSASPAETAHNTP